MGESEAARQLESAADAAIERKDWGAITTMLTALRNSPLAGAEQLQQRASRALDAFAASATRDVYGTVQQSGEQADGFLVRLADMGVPGAALWLVEVRVAWTERGQMVARSGISDERVAGIPGLLDRALSDRGSGPGGNDWFGRACFLTGEYYFWMKGVSTDLGQRRVRALNAYFAGLEAGSSDCAARLVEAKTAEAIPDAALRDAGLTFPAWSELERVLRDPAGVVSRPMTLYGLAIGGLSFADPPASLDDSLELLVQAAEAGYLPARIAIENSVLQDRLSPDQRRRLELQRGSRPAGHRSQQ
jgi:hypothetical protein